MKNKTCGDYPKNSSERRKIKKIPRQDQTIQAKEYVLKEMTENSTYKLDERTERS